MEEGLGPWTFFEGHNSLFQGMKGINAKCRSLLQKAICGPVDLDIPIKGSVWAVLDTMHDVGCLYREADTNTTTSIARLNMQSVVGV